MSAQGSRVVRGLRVAAVALWFRVAALTIVAGLAAASRIVHVAPVVRAVDLASDTLAMGLLALAILLVAGACSQGMPRRRFHAAALCATWAALLPLSDLWGLHLWGPPLLAAELGPLLEATAVVLALSALQRTAQLVGDDKLRATLSTNVKAFAVVTTLGLCLWLVASGAQPGQHLYIAHSFGTTALVAGLVIAAATCTKVASVFRAIPALAVAVTRPAAGDASP